MGLEIFKEHGYIALFGTFTLTSRLMTVIMKIIKCAPARLGKDKAVARQVWVVYILARPRRIIGNVSVSSIGLGKGK
ncbi:MAG: hypothetical protein MUP16_09860 [Sedimentisphaerales bacterium]|nr:hypothetical protein [Sedimentisphaerales bacterium]